MTGPLFLAILLLSTAAFVYGRHRAADFARRTPGGLGAMHSRPIYHGAFVASLVGIPALLLVLVWLLFQQTVIENLLYASLPDDVTAGLSGGERNLLISQILAAAQRRHLRRARRRDPRRRQALRGMAADRGLGAGRGGFRADGRGVRLLDGTPRAALPRAPRRPSAS